MDVLELPYDYDEGLAQAQTLYIDPKTRVPMERVHSRRSIPSTPAFVIPPLRFDMREVEKVRPFVLTTENGPRSVEKLELPVTFDWRHRYGSDSDEIRVKKEGGIAEAAIHSDASSRNIFVRGSTVTVDNFAPIVRQNIYFQGPVFGSFVVLENFLNGDFSRLNGGVYLERGVYGDTSLLFSDDQVGPHTYRGTHSVAVIGWGIARSILVDEGGERADVPYWYVRNSWGAKWGDGGYCKMAMYPWNRVAQLDAKVTLVSPKGKKTRVGGMVIDPVEFFEEAHETGSLRERKFGFKEIFCYVLVPLAILFVVFMLCRRMWRRRSSTSYLSVLQKEYDQS